MNTPDEITPVASSETMPTDNVFPTNDEESDQDGNRFDKALGKSSHQETKLRQPFCNQLEPVDPDQRAFVFGIRSILSEGGKNLSSADLVEAIRDVFPPSRLFCESLIRTPEYYGKLRKVFELYDVVIIEDPADRRLNSCRIARTLYNGPEWQLELRAALELIRESRGQVRSSPFKSPQSPNVHEGKFNPAGTMFARYKDESSTYSGNITQSWPEALDDFIAAADALKMDDSQRLDSLPIMLRGDARRYYTKNVKGVTNSFPNATKMIGDKFNGTTQQHRLKNHLLSLKFDQYMSKNENPSDALAQLISDIEKMFPQVPTSFQCEDNKVSILKNAIIGRSWATMAIADLHKPNATFSNFAADAAMGLQLAADEQRANGNHHMMRENTLGLKTPSGKPEIFWQSRLARNTKTRPFFRKTSFRCYNCGREGHRAANCHDNKRGWDARRIAANRIKDVNQHHNRPIDDKQGYKQVLFELSVEVNDSLNMDDIDNAANVLFGDLQSDSDQLVDPNSHTDKETNDHLGNEESETVNNEQLQDSVWDTLQSEADGHQETTASSILYNSHSSVPNRNLAVTDLLTGDYSETPKHEPRTSPDPNPTDLPPIELGEPSYQPATASQITTSSDRPSCTPHHHDSKTPCNGDILVTTIMNSDHVQSIKPTTFSGACVDTGASKSVIGLTQLQLYSKHTGLKLHLAPSNTIFKFGIGIAKSLGTQNIRLPIHTETHPSYLVITVDVIDVDLPLLIGLDSLLQHNLTVDIKNRRLINIVNQYTIPLRLKGGHLYYEWPMEILFTRAELIKLHQQFYHPSATKLMNLLIRAKPSDCTPETRKILEQISKSCDICATFRPKPLHFKVSMPKESIVFNNELSLDLLWLENKAVLHIVDMETGFGAARFLESQTVEGVWQSFLLAWVTIYPGYPNTIRTDQGSQFVSLRWEQRAAAAGISLKLTGVESHNSLGLGERYHSPLKRVYSKVRAAYPELPANVSLAISQKAANDTMGPRGLVPSLLVFGTIPKFEAASSPYTDQNTRMKTLQLARQEMNTIVAQMRVKEALRARTPAASNQVVNEGDYVKVYRETDRKFHGPYKVLKVEQKQVFLDLGDRVVQHNISQVIPFTAPTEPLTHIGQSLVHLASPLHPQPSIIAPIFITEVLKPGDPRSTMPEFQEAKRKEIEGLVRRNTWQIVKRSAVPGNVSILSGRHVLAIKDKETDKPIYKARYVVGGHRDPEKNYLIHNSQTVSPMAMRIICQMSVLNDWPIWVCDISQAYVQSRDPLSRPVYLQPPPELQLPSSMTLRLLRPLYGLCDSGDYWFKTLKDHYLNDLHLRQHPLEPALFYEANSEGELNGITGSYVDDTLHTGSDSFAQLTKQTALKFESKPMITNSFKFAGIQLDKRADGTITLTQQPSIERLKLLAPDATHRDYKSRLMETAWLCQTRPDVSCQVSLLAQHTEDAFNAHRVDLVKNANAMIRKVKRSPKKGITIRKVSKETLHIRSYSDGSFGNAPEYRSQLGYLTFLCDDEDNATLIAFRSFRSRRIVRSVLGAEVYALAEAFDNAYSLRHVLKPALNKYLPIRLYTDSKSLFDVISQESTTSEKRLAIDLQAVKEAYAASDICDIALVDSANNPADQLTKNKKNDVLERAIDDGKLDHAVRQWVIRDDQ